MKKLQGVAVCGGICFGRLFFFRRGPESVCREPALHPLWEMERFESAREQANLELQQLYEKELLEVGKNEAAIFEIHRTILTDPDFYHGVETLITADGCNAEYAVQKTAEKYAALLEHMENAYFCGRSADIKDIASRLIHIMRKDPEHSIVISEPVILITDTLSPSEIVRLDRNKILGIAASNGSAFSHAAILAKTMNIPTVVQLGGESGQKYDGMAAALDAFEGLLYLNPDRETRDRLRKKHARHHLNDQISSFYEGPSLVFHGRPVSLYANASSEQEACAALQNGADGIGLLRSETFYLEQEACPDEEMLFATYCAIAQLCEKKPVTFRTIDIGSDKTPGYFDMLPEQNPALGCRGIRFCLKHTELFCTQLRAMLRASAYGTISILLPMVSNVDEVLQTKLLLEGIKAEFIKQAIAFDPKIPLGIMIETPAAALTSGELARHADFFSIGSNDLAQYTLAVDRQSATCLFEPDHPAVLELIRLTVKNAHNAGIPVSICGELAADLKLTHTLLQMGIDQISVAPHDLRSLRKKIMEFNT